MQARIGPFHSDYLTMRPVRGIEIGQVVSSSGKGRFKVNFFGLGETRELSSRSLTILTNVDVRRMARHNAADTFVRRSVLPSAQVANNVPVDPVEPVASKRT